MKAHPAIKILVIAFSLTLGTFVVWQMKSDMSANDSEAPAKTEETTNEEKEPSPVIISTKNPSGSVRFKDVENILPDQKKEKVEQPPLLPSSKSMPILPPVTPNKPKQE